MKSGNLSMQIQVIPFGVFFLFPYILMHVYQVLTFTLLISISIIQMLINY